MSPLATLFVAAIALYLVECLVIVPEDARVLVEMRRGQWRVARHGFGLGALRKRLVLLPPVAPHAAVLVLPAWSVTLAPSGFTFRDERGSWRAARYEELDRVVAAAASVRWHDGSVATHSRRRAQWLARTLIALRDAPERSRVGLIETALEDVTSEERVRSRIDALRKESRRVRLSGVVLFAHLFLVWPALVRWLGISVVWPAILLELVVLELLVCWTYVRARHALAAPNGDDHGTSVLTLALSPPAATRAATSLGRDLLGDVHPLAAALQLCGDADAKSLAARALREARFGVAGAEASASSRASEQQWFAERWRYCLETLLDRRVGLASIPSAPVRDGESGSYCPRCWTQYSASGGRCAECTDVALHAFAAP